MTKVYKMAVFKPIVAMANNPKILGVAVLATWFVAASLFAIIEHTSIIDSLYWAMTTMSTVGYGDFSPVTVLGKIVAIALMIWSIFVLVPCTVANVVDAVRRDDNQFTHDEQEWMEDTLQRLCDQIGVETAAHAKSTTYEEV